MNIDTVGVKGEPVTYSGTMSWGRFWRTQVRANKRVFVWSFFVFLTVVLLWTWSDLESFSIPELFVTALGAVAFFIGTWVCSWRRIYKKTPVYRHPFSGTISPEGFTASGPHGRSEVTWSSF